MEFQVAREEPAVYPVYQYFNQLLSVGTVFHVKSSTDSNKMRNKLQLSSF